MVEDDADAFVRFRNVRVICSTAPALFCGIGNKRVWLPRRHISGRLWCRGDQGMLHIRRWVARERHLLDPRGGGAGRTPAEVHLAAAVARGADGPGADSCQRKVVHIAPSKTQRCAPPVRIVGSPSPRR